MVHLRMRHLAAARGDFESYLRLAPAAGDREEVEKRVRSLRSDQAQLN
jgi:tRNA isopentenyl-2-thiomethyl-A-37 hydroxylase MiaE